MKAIILYGSRYGSARRYAEELSEQTGIPTADYKNAPPLSDKNVIVYLGGLYAGGLPGLVKTFRGVSLRNLQRLIIATVGLSDPQEPENRKNILHSLQKQLPNALLDKTNIFHLRGSIDYTKLRLAHRTMMALLYRSLQKKPAEEWSAEDRALAETYGRKADFVDFSTLRPIIKEIQREVK